MIVFGKRPRAERAARRWSLQLNTEALTLATREAQAFTVTVEPRSTHASEPGRVTRDTPETVTP